LISGIHIFTSNNVIIDIKNYITTSKKLFLISTIEFEWQPMVKFHWKYNYRYISN